MWINSQKQQNKLFLGCRKHGIKTRDRRENEGENSSQKEDRKDSYLSFGFTSVRNSMEPDGLCLICIKILVNSSLTPAKLKGHFASNHEHLTDKDISFFQRHKDTYEATVLNLHKFAKTVGGSATVASFRLSYRIAWCLINHIQLQRT